MSVYKRKLSKGQKWWYKFDFNGITYSSKAEYQTRNEAKKAEAKKLTQLKEDQPNERITFLDLCNLRLDFIKTKSDYYYRDHKQVLKPLVKEWGRLYIDQINKKMVIAHFTELSEKLSKRGKDNYLVNKSIRILKAMFYWAMDDLELLDKNPAKIKLFPIAKKLKYIPPGEDIEKVLAVCNDSQRALIRFVMDTGARIVEALRVRDTDFKNGYVTLWTRKNKQGDLRARMIPCKANFKLTKGRIFAEWDNYPHFLSKVCKKAKVKPFSWHCLRHRKASLLANEGMPLIQIRDYLGHHDIATTNIYLQSIFGYDFATNYEKKPS